MTPDEILRTRLALGMNQQQFATALKVSVRSVSMWETGAATPSKPSLTALAKLKRKADRTKKEDQTMERPTTVYWRCEHTGCAGIIAADWPAPREWTELTACPICGHRSRCSPAVPADYVLADQADLKLRYDQQQP